MTRKLNIDSGLQDWKTEHQAVAGIIFYCRDSGYFSVSASSKLSCNLTGIASKSATNTYRQSVGNKLKNQSTSYESKANKIKKRI